MKKPKSEKKSAAPQAAGKRGRKPDTPEQKAEKAAAKAAAKAAEKKVTGEQRAEAAKAVAGHNSADPKLRELFVRSVDQYKKLKERAKSENGKLRAFFKDALRDGFTKDQFETAVLCEDPEGEAKVQERIAKALQAAQFVGAMLGKHLDAFNEPDRTPAADRAYAEGQRASMENKAALPPYAPETEQYRRYMAGFHDHQASIAARNLKPINPPAAPPAPTVPAPAMTREEMRQQVPTAPEPAHSDGTGAENDNVAEQGNGEMEERTVG